MLKAHGRATVAKHALENGARQTGGQADYRYVFLHPTSAAMKNIFDQAIVEALVARINTLTPSTPAQWGKMTVDQMLAHVNVPYIMVYDNTFQRPGLFKRTLFKLFVKGAVVGPKPYPRNGPTAPEFKMVGAKDFEQERQRLIGYMRRVQKDGAQAFDGKPSNAFGPLTSAEWNTLFAKHLEHHLTQFGV